MKVIDVARKGNVLKFFFGADDCEDYWGDDWNDAPWEHNAGPVYERYVKATVEVAVPFDYDVFEPMNLYHFGIARESLKGGYYPCVVVVPDDGYTYSFEGANARKDAVRIYFGDKMEDVTDIFTEGILYSEVTNFKVVDVNGEEQ